MLFEKNPFDRLSGNQLKLLAIPLLAFYSGRRGKAGLKYLFYIYYPAHLALIYLIQKFFF